MCPSLAWWWEGPWEITVEEPHEFGAGEQARNSGESPSEVLTGAFLQPVRNTYQGCCEKVVGAWIRVGRDSCLWSPISGLGTLPCGAHWASQSRSLFSEFSAGRRLGLTRIAFWAFVGQCPGERSTDIVGPQEICCQGTGGWSKSMLEAPEPGVRIVFGVFLAAWKLIKELGFLQHSL